MLQNIIPTPQRIEPIEGTVSVPYTVYSADFPAQCEVLAVSFEKIFRKPLAIAEGGILLKKDASLPPEGYRIDSREGITLFAADEAGILHACATLLMATEAKDALTMEKALIEDAPEKGYRAVMIDLARQWHPAKTVLRYIDICFMLKLNYLQLHFVDDQAFTLPSKAYPKLNEGRHYTLDEIAEMNTYAAARGITLIPEFEAPGHAKALNAAYPELFANELEGEGGVSYTESGELVTGKNIVCAGKPETMAAIQTLLAEICDLFPNSPYIHIGGDEANIKTWNYCTHCKRYMAEQGIEDEYELYSEFVGRVSRMVLALGRTPIVWEGFPPKGVHHIPKETIVCAWESHYHLAPDLLKAGFKIINGSWKPLYIVPSPNHRWGVPEILNWDVHQWQHWWPNSPARLNPIHVAPTDQVLGGQYSIWECTYEQEISRAVENLPAFAERVWRVERLWADEEFLHRTHYLPVVRRIFMLIQEM